MATPALKFTEYQSALTDFAKPIDELSLHRIIADCRRTIANMASSDIAADAYAAMGLAYVRLANYQEACASFQRLVKLQPYLSTHHVNLGVSLFGLGRNAEALEEWITASELEGGYNHVVLANIAEVFARLGRYEDARVTFEEAIQLADLENPAHLFVLAMQAAAIGMDRAAVEFLARFMSNERQRPLANRDALQFVNEDPEALQKYLAIVPELRRALAKSAMRHAIRSDIETATTSIQTPPICDNDDIENLAIAVLEETRQMRTRANEAAVLEAGDVN